MLQGETNQFKSIVNAFFRKYPMKGEAELYTYVELRSQVNGSEFREWRENETCRKY